MQSRNVSVVLVLRCLPVLECNAIPFWDYMCNSAEHSDETRHHCIRLHSTQESRGTQPEEKTEEKFTTANIDEKLWRSGIRSANAMAMVWGYEALAMLRFWAHNIYTNSVWLSVSEQITNSFWRLSAQCRHMRHTADRFANTSRLASTASVSYASHQS